MDTNNQDSVTMSETTILREDIQDRNSLAEEQTMEDTTGRSIFDDDTDAEDFYFRKLHEKVEESRQRETEQKELDLNKRRESELVDKIDNALKGVIPTDYDDEEYQNQEAHPLIQLAMMNT